MNIKQERKFIQQLLEEGQLDSISVQVIALNRFANSIGYKAVGGDIRKGFSRYSRPAFSATRQDFCSLEEMQSCYNRGFRTLQTSAHKVVGNKIVERVSLQCHKRTTKQLSSQLHWLNSVKED